MKEYLKPDLEYIKFTSEVIADLMGGEGGTSGNDFDDDDFS